MEKFEKLKEERDNLKAFPVNNYFLLLFRTGKDTN